MAPQDTQGFGRFLWYLAQWLGHASEGFDSPLCRDEMNRAWREFTTVRYVIRWNWGGGTKCYIWDKKSAVNGYTEKLDEAKVWKTRGAAERYLSLKDRTWASQCVIEGI